MSYLDRLKAQFPEKVSTLPTAKTAKSPYDSFDSAQGRQFLETEVALSAGVATPRNLGSDGTPLSAAALAIQRETSDPGALWWRIAILEPGGRTVEVDTPSGWTLGECSLRRALPRPWVRRDADRPASQASGIGQPR